MEAALVNVLSPGDAMLALVAGASGRVWVDIGRAHGMDLRTLDAPWGEGVQARAWPSPGPRSKVRAVFVSSPSLDRGAPRHRGDRAGHAPAPGRCLWWPRSPAHGEPGPGDAGPGRGRGRGGSQKALALPPGLAFLALGPRAWERADEAKAPRFYFDLRRERKAQGGGESAFTPAISLIVALRSALAFVEDLGGVDALVKNAGTLRAMTRAAAGALGLPLVATRDR